MLPESETCCWFPHDVNHFPLIQRSHNYKKCPCHEK